MLMRLMREFVWLARRASSNNSRCLCLCISVLLLGSLPALVNPWRAVYMNGHNYKGPNGGVNGDDGYYFTAIDFHTGQIVFQRLIGQGTYFDNYYSGIHLGPDGKTAYIGVVPGLVAVRDTP